MSTLFSEFFQISICMRESFNNSEESKRKTNCRHCNKEIDLYQYIINNGIKYYRKDKTTKYCSSACAGKEKRRFIEKICATCGKTFSTKPHESKTHCSILCGFQSFSKTDKVCEYCGADFIPHSRKQIFCSPQCQRVDSFHKRRVKENTQITLRKCYTCDNSFLGPANKLFCSKLCHIPKKVRHNQESERIKRELVTLKGGKCLHCQKTYRLSSLCFHHLRDKLFTLDRSNLLRYNIEDIKLEADKCILLCHNCHIVEHQKLKRNNKERSTDKIKRHLISLHGGHCVGCGWASEYIATLTFDHISDKLFELNTNTLYKHSYDAIIEESMKCQLLCANCHIGKNDTINRQAIMSDINSPPLTISIGRKSDVTSLLTGSIPNR